MALPQYKLASHAVPNRQRGNLEQFSSRHHEESPGTTANELTSDTSGGWPRIQRMAGMPRHIVSTLEESDEDEESTPSSFTPLSPPPRQTPAPATLEDPHRYSVAHQPQPIPPQDTPNVTTAAPINDPSTTVTTIPFTLFNWTVTNPGKTPIPESDDYECWNLQQLRKECTQRKIRVTREKADKNANESVEKTTRVRRLKKHDADREAAETAVDKENTQPAALRKSQHCAARLMNIMFADKFVLAFASLGDKANRRAIDEGNINATSTFWIEVTQEFHTNTTDYNELVCPDDARIKAAGIDPSHIRLHTTQKLIEIWKNVNQQYQKSIGRFQQSGKHSSDFFSFAQGQVDVLYLRLCLQRRPNLTNFVEGGFYDEDKTDSLSPYTSDTESPHQRRRGKKRQAPNSTTSGSKWQQDLVKNMARVTDAILNDNPRPGAVDGNNFSKTLDGLTKLHALIGQVEARIEAQRQSGSVNPVLERSLALHEQQLVELEKKL